MSQQKLPERFKVDVENISSPKIEAIEKATKRLSNWLHEDLREIIKSLQYLQKLPDEIGDLKKQLVKEFRKLFVGQITAEMKSREANIRVAEEKAELAEQHVERKQEQLEESQERVRKRFEKLAESVSADHKRNLERLDSHAYRITEEIYPEQIQERFSYESPIFWDALAKHSAQAAAARTGSLAEGGEEAATSVSEFVDAREAFYEELRRLASPEAEPGKYELPYWFVEVENEDTGEQRLDVIFPWDLHDTDPPISDDHEAALRHAARTEIKGEVPGRPLTDEERNKVLSRLTEEHETPPDEIFRGDEPALSVSLPD